MSLTTKSDASAAAGGAGQSVTNRPRLAFPATNQDGTIVIDRAGIEYAIASDGIDSARLLRMLEHMDGSRTIAELAAEIGDTDAVLDAVASLDTGLLLDDAEPARGRSGLDVLLELEDLANDLHEKIMYNNVYWRALRDPAPDLPRQLMHGFCVENYHFLFRESYFDSPVLSYQPSTQVRLVMNEFYREEYGHDEILLRSLNSLGYSREDLADTMPLPQTMAMCNALAWWSMTDPIFFFTTLGILEGKEIAEGEQDFFLEACDALGMDQAFVKPIRTHANINSDSEHGNLTRAIFREIECLDEATVRRLRAQTHLFFELYDKFFAGIYEHYSSAPTLLRRVSAL
jgi:hypothetical protein